MARFIIQGQNKISGTLKPIGNKNAILPMLAATLLTDEPVTLRNIPLIEDVMVMLQLLETLGVDIQLKGRTATLQAKGFRQQKFDKELCRRVRSSILLAGPLTARHGKATLYPPGGDVIGRRRLDTHFFGLRALGITIDTKDCYTFTRKKLKGADILLDEASVTATENIMMAATLAEGKTVLFNAACEPHVEDLGHLLIKMGAKIDGLGTNRITLHGVKKLSGAKHTVSPDYIEMGSFMAAAAVTGGRLTIEDVGHAEPLKIMSRAFNQLGSSWSLKENKLTLDGSKPLRVKKDFGNQTPKLEDGPWPGFPSDLMSVAVVMATQAKGSVLFFEKLFESRMYFVDHLISMGADIIQCDPHRVLVNGPSELRGAHLTSPDIRAGVSLIIAALCAKGESIIENAQVVDRGYEKIDRRLRKLGADIVREG